MSSSQNNHASNRHAKDSSPDHDDTAFENLPDEEKEYYEPTHIWYSGTIFTLAAACFGPLASAFGICALAESWRVTVPSGGVEINEVIIMDPKWLIALNALSLAISILANISFLLNLSHRVSYKIAQPISIVGWYISFILLIVIICLTPTRLKAPAVYNLAQSFVYACLAAALYFILATLLISNTYGAYRGYYEPDFSATLTLPQRTLMGQSTCFIFYLLCGAAVFARIESWHFVDGVYWATVTLLTIGYGDVTPATHLGRSLIIPYAIAGIILLGLVVGSIGSLVLDRAAEKMGARMTVTEREKLRDEFEAASSKFKNEGNGSETREKQEFDLMRQIQTRARSKQRWSLITISTMAVLILWFVGAAIFYKTESSNTSFQAAPWSYFQAVYFVFISLLTIGYGDFSVHSNIGRPLFVFWGLLAVPTMTILIASMGAMVLIIIKAIIAKIDGFLVLPHETNGNENSFSKKALQMSKLKMKAKVNHNDDGHEDGLEVEDGGVRNADTGRIENADKAMEDVPQVNEGADATTRERTYLIAKEIRGLLEHVNGTPPKTYTFEEWMRFLKLLGIRYTDEDMREANRGNGNLNGGGEGRVRGDGDERWSWLRDDGPLFGTKTETEWVLEKLSGKLEEALKPS